MATARCTPGACCAPAPSPRRRRPRRSPAPPPPPPRPPRGGEPVPVTVRFSNGSGDPGEPDSVPDVRGMATKFYLPDGSRTDIVTQTAPRFPVRTPDAFIAFVRAMAPGPGQLVRLPLFLARHPEAVAALPANVA